MLQIKLSLRIKEKVSNQCVPNDIKNGFNLFHQIHKPYVFNRIIAMFSFKGRYLTFLGFQKCITCWVFFLSLAKALCAHGPNNPLTNYNDLVLLVVVVY